MCLMDRHNIANHYHFDMYLLDMGNNHIYLGNMQNAQVNIH
jgi:hypothetical protein